MREKRKYFLLIFIIVVIILAMVVSLNANYFNEVIKGSIDKYGYIAVFLFSSILDMIEQPIGPEVPGLIAVLFGLNIPFVFIVTVLGSYCGGIASFYIGKRFLSSEIMDYCRTDKYKNYCSLFHKYGKFSVLIAALTPIPFVLFSWLAGSFHMKLKDFVIYGLIPRTLRIGFVLFVIGLFV